MHFKKADIITFITSLCLLVALCLVFNKLSRGAFFVRDRERAHTQAFVSEEFAIKEEKKNEASKAIESHVATTSVKVPVFVYHSVRPYIQGESKSQDAYDITPELFEEQLTYLEDNGYTTVSMDELSYLMSKGVKETDTKKRVVLSFDDGWENQYTYAYPLLKKHRMTATFYIYTHPVGYRNFLTWPQIREMRQGGMEIGSHTLTHPLFKKINEEDIRKEISESKTKIEKELGVPVRHFASPFGYSNAHIEDIIEEAGYDTGRTIYRGIVQKDPYALRGNLMTDSLNDFIKVLEGKDPYK